MDSIDRLRKWADGLCGIWLDPNDHSIIVTTCDDTPPSMDCVSLREHVSGILDAIEREVGEMQRALTIDAKPMTDENMAERGWVRLPKDADGEYIHVGDVVAATLAHGGSGRWVVDRMELTRAYDQDLWQIALDKDGACWVTPSTVRHYHAPTVEDVLREFGRGWHEQMNGPETFDIADYVERYAAKLTLRGDE